MRRFALATLALAACGGPYEPDVVHGGGLVEIDVAPITEGAGITVLGSVEGGSQDQVVLVEEAETECVSFLTEEHLDAGVEHELQVCADRLAPEELDCFETVDLTLRVDDVVGAEAWMLDGHGNLDEDDWIEVETVGFEWEPEKDGSFTGEFELTNPCFGPDPVPHRIEARWTFEGTWDRVAPRGDAPNSGNGGGGGWCMGC